MNTTSTTTTNRRIRRLAGRLALTAVAAGVIGAGPLAAAASADCPFGAPACPTRPTIDLPEVKPVPDRPDWSSIDPSILDDLVNDPGDLPIIDDPSFDPSDLPPGVLDPTPDDPTTVNPPFDPSDIPPGVLDPTPDDPGAQPTGDPTGDPNNTTTTTTTSVPGNDGEQATPVADATPGGELAFTGGSAALALAGAGVLAVGALTVGGSVAARRRNQG